MQGNTMRNVESYILRNHLLSSITIEGGFDRGWWRYLEWKEGGKEVKKEKKTKRKGGGKEGKKEGRKERRKEGRKERRKEGGKEKKN